jgi:Xaa-Pro aminopeptidase
MYKNRLSRLREHFSQGGIDALLISSNFNRAYLSGFQGTSGWLIITSDEQILVTDFRYLNQARSEAIDYQIVLYKTSLPEKINDLLKERKIQKLGFESQHLTYEQYHKFKSQLEVDLIPVSSPVEKLRELKDPAEIERIKNAVSVADKTFEHILKFIKPGVTERDLAAEMEYFMRKEGAGGPSFDTIIASGFRGALPHGTASDRSICPGDLIVMDYGAILNGYCSDITRTVVVGTAASEQKKIYDIVLEAQTEALGFVGPGRKCCEVDAFAREIIAGYGFGDNFGHGLGHGVGLEVHEKPAVNPRNQDILEPGMVITVEPGIYIDGWGGVRIEDMVLVTDKGCEILTQSPKELIEVS